MCKVLALSINQTLKIYFKPIGINTFIYRKFNKLICFDESHSIFDRFVPLYFDSLRSLKKILSQMWGISRC